MYDREHAPAVSVPFSSLGVSQIPRCFPCSSRLSRGIRSISCSPDGLFRWQSRWSPCWLLLRGGIVLGQSYLWPSDIHSCLGTTPYGIRVCDSLNLDPFCVNASQGLGFHHWTPSSRARCLWVKGTARFQQEWCSTHLLSAEVFQCSEWTFYNLALRKMKEDAFRVSLSKELKIPHYQGWKKINLTLPSTSLLPSAWLHLITEPSLMPLNSLSRLMLGDSLDYSSIMQTTWTMPKVRHHPQILHRN